MKKAKKSFRTNILLHEVVKKRPNAFNLHDNFGVYNTTRKEELATAFTPCFVKLNKSFLFSILESDIQKVSQFLMSHGYGDPKVCKLDRPGKKNG